MHEVVIYYKTARLFCLTKKSYSFAIAKSHGMFSERHFDVSCFVAQTGGDDENGLINGQSQTAAKVKEQKADAA